MIEMMSIFTTELKFYVMALCIIFPEERHHAIFIFYIILMYLSKTYMSKTFSCIHSDFSPEIYFFYSNDFSA